MAVSTIHIQDRNLRRAMRAMEAGLRNPAPVYGRAARHMRDYVRNTITLQGRANPYPRLSQWTRDRTGRRKALITLRPRIKARWDRTQGEVYFDPISAQWNITQHHTGFTSPAVVNKRMAVPLKSGGVRIFWSRKPSKIPARKVWPSRQELEREVVPFFSSWVDRMARSRWR